MKNTTLTPVRLRIMLSIAMVLIIALGVGVFIYGYKQLKSHASDAQTVAFNADASRSSLQNLAITKKFLEENADTVDRADKLVAKSKLYQYQDQIIGDINKYATEAGLSITNISFNNAPANGAGAGAAAATATAATAAVASTTPAPVGIKSTTASITLQNPADYKAILTFIHLIEQSLFRMQISKIGLSRSSETDSTKITSDALSIEVYIQ